MRLARSAAVVLFSALLAAALLSWPSAADDADAPAEDAPTVVPGAEIPEIIPPSAVFEAPYDFTIEQAYADPDRPAVYVLGTQEKLLVWPMLVFA